MKKLRSQLAVAGVCCILGFMLAYQFRIINFQETEVNSQVDSTQITAEVAQLNKQKDDLNNQINELQNKIKQYQDAAANKSDVNKQIVSDYNDLNLISGNTDVEGQGIIITITPKNNMFSPDITNVSDVITDQDLIDLVNELRFGGAEAISINDIRILADTGIKTSGGVTNIFLGTKDRISPYEKITIKAIGNKDKLNSAMVFPGVLDIIPSSNYEVDAPQKSSNILIYKTNTVTNFQYAKTVNN
jgi:uncharacterized protein YlxW (UPF0749 family)